MWNKTNRSLPFSIASISKKCLFYIGLTLSIAPACQAKNISRLLTCMVTYLLIAPSMPTSPQESAAITCEISDFPTPFQDWYVEDSLMTRDTYTMPADVLHDYHELRQAVEALKLRLQTQEKKLTQQVATCEDKHNALVQRINTLEVDKLSDQISTTLGLALFLCLLFACYKAHQASMEVVKSSEERGMNKMNLRAISPVFNEKKNAPRLPIKSLAPPSSWGKVKELRTAVSNSTDRSPSLLDDMDNYDLKELDRLHTENKPYAHEQKIEEEESKEEKTSNPLYNVD